MCDLGFNDERLVPAEVEPEPEIEYAALTAPAVNGCIRRSATGGEGKPPRAMGELYSDSALHAARRALVES